MGEVLLWGSVQSLGTRHQPRVRTLSLFPDPAQPQAQHQVYVTSPQPAPELEPLLLQLEIPLMLLPGGAHLGLFPGFEPGQHIPVKNLKQARQSFPIPVIDLEQRAIFVCASSIPQ